MGLCFAIFFSWAAIFLILLLFCSSTSAVAHSVNHLIFPGGGSETWWVQLLVPSYFLNQDCTTPWRFSFHISSSYSTWIMLVFMLVLVIIMISWLLNHLTGCGQSHGLRGCCRKAEGFGFIKDVRRIHHQNFSVCCLDPILFIVMPTVSLILSVCAFCSLLSFSSFTFGNLFVMVSLNSWVKREWLT